jgi:transcriptional regulator of acetoin/glycerol metabolism
MLPTADHHLMESRALLEGSRAAEISPDLVRTEIRDSWQRCLESGLHPSRLPRQSRLTAQEVRALIEQDSYLVHLARSEFRKLQKQLPGDHFVIGFANREAVLMDVISSAPSGTPEVAPGFCWKENLRGTNALGTAAFSRRPVSVHSLEHFFREYSGLTCSAAPVTDPDGQVAGILDVSSDCQLRQQQTMSLIRMSALHMEAELFRERFRSETILQFHSRDEFANTLDAGLIALDDEGGILRSNPQARFLLEGLPMEAGHHFDEVFRVGFREFATGAPADGGLRPLVDRKGSTYSVRVCNLRANLGARPRSSFAAVRSTPTELAEDLPIGFVCQDAAVSRAMSVVRRAVAMPVPLLIRGATGTGKEMLAQYAHGLSRRSGRFVAVNCASIPEELIEAELFGYREGAFTGARSGGSAGLIVQAHGGTLFLDEIGDMPMSLQPSLLRFLDHWTVRPIGAGREQKVDVQLITATNCDLEEAVAQKRFRRDLLYRIAGVEVVLPALRERSDFEAIVRDLLSRISPQTGVADDALQLLKEQAWPGNIRELRNILTRAAIEGCGSILSTAVIAAVLQKGGGNGTSQPARGPALLDLRRNAVLDGWRRNGGNISRTAQELSVSRNTVYRELRKAGAAARVETEPNGID